MIQMQLWNNIILQSPWWLLLLLLIPLIIFLRRRRRKQSGLAVIEMPFDQVKVPRTWRVIVYGWLEPLFWVAMSLLVIAMARPQSEHAEESVKGEGIDIFLVMDLSSSMLARDFEPDRLSVSKQVAVDFTPVRS